jgi:hypothetical protein
MKQDYKRMEISTHENCTGRIDSILFGRKCLLLSDPNDGLYMQNLQFWKHIKNQIENIDL